LDFLGLGLSIVQASDPNLALSTQLVSFTLAIQRLINGNLQVSLNVNYKECLRVDHTPTHFIII